MLLAKFQATRWVRFLDSGRNKPALVGCEVVLSAGTTEQDFVVKLNFAEGGIQPCAPVCEAVSALLAQDLGLPIADPCLVEITREFADSIPNPKAKARCLGSLGSNFATRHLGPGYSLIQPEGLLPASCLPTMADIYLFDAVIQNHDRVTTNPNALISGEDLRIIDHEMGYNLLELALADFTEPESCFGWSKHVFHRQLKSSKGNVDKLVTNFSALTNRRFDEYLASLPNTWAGKAKYSAGIRAHLIRAKASIGHLKRYADAHFFS